jgi:hypothetical protein
MNAPRAQFLKLASALVLALTLVLFVTAAWLHGLSAELLLEAGVFLVSVKLVLSTQKSEIVVGELQDRLASMEAKLDSILAKRP